MVVRTYIEYMNDFEYFRKNNVDRKQHSFIEWLTV